MTDQQLKALANSVCDIYNEIELEIIKDIAERLWTYEEPTGVLAYYLQKLDEVGALNGFTVRLIAKYSGKTEKEVKRIVEKAGYANLDMDLLNKAYKQGLISNPDDLFLSPVMADFLDNTYRDLSESLKLINTKAIEGSKKAYMGVLNKAYIEVAGGIKDYNTAIRDALYDMASKGITAATYVRRDGRVVNYGIEGCVRRDVLTAVYQEANASALNSLKELGAEHVEVSSHLGARTGDGKNPITNHAGWQGKVYKIEGEDEYPNLVEKTGYGDIRGLGGVNCRHRMYAFFKGISKPAAVQYDSKENKRVYEAAQKQRAYERKLRQLKREKQIADVCQDADRQKKIDKQIKDVQNQLTEHLEQNNLRREPEREQTYG